MVDRGDADDFASINSGLCEEFAEDLIAEVRALSGEGSEIDSYEINHFFQIDPKTGFAFESGGPIDRKLLSAALPNMKPPCEMSWDEFDEFLANSGMGWGFHIFVISDGLVYDSEAPEGVESIFDLPMFQRYMEWFSTRPKP